MLVTVSRFYSSLLVAFMCLFHGYNADMDMESVCGAERRRDPDTNCTQCRDGLDLSTNCTTCLSPSPVQCQGEDQNCTIGHFTFSALFHSYTPNSENNVRLIYCVQPHGSPPFSTQLPSQKKLNFTNSIPQGFIVQGTQNPDVNWNRSNPYTVELRIWTAQIQFFIIAYSFPGREAVGVAFDMFLINLTLNIGPTFTDRTTYYGIMGSAVTFDLSFRVQCSENYYGPQCNVFCSEVAQQLSCDNEGNVVCVNQYRNPETNCTECLPGRNITTDCTECLPLRDPSTNCERCLPWRDITTNCSECLPGRDPANDCLVCLPERDLDSNCSEFLSDSSETELIIGVVAGGLIVGMVLLILISLTTLLFLKTVKRNKEDHFYETSDLPDSKKSEPPKTEKLHSQIDKIHDVAKSDTSNDKTQAVEQHLFDNPIYGESIIDNVIKESQQPETKGLHEFNNPIYGNNEIDDMAKSDDKTNRYSLQAVEQHNFDNTIYEEEMTENVYSHTSHSVTSPQIHESYSHYEAPDPAAQPYYNVIPSPEYDTAFPSPYSRLQHNPA